MRLLTPSTTGPEAPPQPTSPSGWLRRDLRAPLAVWCLLALHTLLLLLWTTLQPAYRGLDEPAHVDMVLFVPPVLDWPAPGEMIVNDTIISTQPEAGYAGVPFRRLPAAEALPREQRPSFAEADLSGRGPANNQMVQHPPLYYTLTNAALDLWPGREELAFDAQVALMRVLTLLAVAPLPLLCWLASRRLGLSVPAGVAAAMLPMAVPGLTRVSSSVTNDALLTLTVGVATVLALAVAGGDLRRRTALALGVTAVLGMWTKGLGLILPVLVVAAYTVAVLRGSRPRAALVPGALATGLAAVLGGSWYVRNVVVAGAVQPNGYPGGGLPYPEVQGGGVGEWAGVYVAQMAFRFWSALGQPEPPELDATVCWVLSGAVVLLSVAALLLAPRRRLLVGFALLPLAGLLMLVAYGSYSNYQTYDRFIGVQGRYLYPAVVGLAAVLAVALERLAGPLRRLLPVGMLVFAGYLQWLGVQAVLVGYWTPAGAPFDYAAGFDTLETWSALPEALVRLLWAGAGLAAVATVAAVVLGAVRRPREPAPLA